MVTRQHRWSVVLAGGEGERMRSFIEHRWGRHRPKQYCSFVGRRTMFETTLDRASRIVGDDSRIVSVIGAGHRKYLRGLKRDLSSIHLIEQPRQLDTFCGVFTATAYILAADRDAVVLFFPSDHYIAPEREFQKHLEAAISAAVETERLVLLGAVPDRPETDYGWIQARSNAGCTANSREVLRFHEKPRLKEAVRYMGLGAYWNTMVFAARALDLWEMGHLCQPKKMAEFEKLVRTWRAIHQGTVDSSMAEIAITHVYDRLEATNFSSDLLQRIPGRCLVRPLEDVRWSDWGSPGRVKSDLARFDADSKKTSALLAERTTV